MFSMQGSRDAPNKKGCWIARRWRTGPNTLVVKQALVGRNLLWSSASAVPSPAVIAVINLSHCFYLIFYVKVGQWLLPALCAFAVHKIA
jgi:hypothetical protein